MSADPRNAPTHGVHPTEKMTPNSTEEKNPSWRQRILLTVEEIDLDDTEEVQPEGDDYQTAHHVDGALVLDEERAYRRGQSAHSDEHAGEPQHEPKGVTQHDGRAHFLAGGKVGDVDGNHGKQARRHEGDDAFQKGDEIGHRSSSCFARRFAMSRIIPYLRATCLRLHRK